MEGLLLKAGSGADLDVVTAGAGDVLVGKVIVDKDGNPLEGNLPDKGTWNSSELAAGASVAIPYGKHSGKGEVTAKSLASQTGGATATDSVVKKGATYWKNGVKRTGTLANLHTDTGITLTAADKRGIVNQPTGNNAVWRTTNSDGVTRFCIASSRTGWVDNNVVFATKDSIAANVIGLTANVLKSGISVLGVTGNVRQVKEWYGEVTVSTSRKSFETGSHYYAEFSTGIEHPMAMCGNFADTTGSYGNSAFFGNGSLLVCLNRNAFYTGQVGSKDALWGNTIRFPVADSLRGVTFAMKVVGW